jgi:hypothetical protein
MKWERRDEEHPRKEHLTGAMVEVGTQLILATTAWAAECACGDVKAR